MFKSVSYQKVRYPGKPKRANVGVMTFVPPTNVLISQFRQVSRGVAARVFSRVN